LGGGEKHAAAFLGRAPVSDAGNGERSMRVNRAERWGGGELVKYRSITFRFLTAGSQDKRSKNVDEIFDEPLRKMRLDHARLNEGFGGKGKANSGGGDGWAKKNYHTSEKPVLGQNS